MLKRIRAVYREGAFHTDEPVDLPEGASVWLDITLMEPEEVLRELQKIYEGLSEGEVAEIEKAMLANRRIALPAPSEGGQKQG